MSKRHVLVLMVVLASIALVYQPVVAKEDTAQIKLKKTVISKKSLYTYTVKKGDVISEIIRQVPGITEQDISNNYHTIRELNPNIPNINKLEVGQSLILPGKPLTEAENNEAEKASVSAENIPAEKEPVSTENVSSEKEPASSESVSDAPQTSYRVRRGDTLYKIIRSKLKVNEVNIPQTVRAIKSINPSIKNVNRIYAGTLIKLPGKTVFVKTPEEIKPVSQDMAATTSDKSIQPAQIIEVKDKKMMPPEARLALLKQIVTQMNGTFTTSGNYYLPIPNAGQITIDCSKIPLIEFETSTVFLDLENRADNNLKKIIGSWKNYSLVKINNDDDIIGVLKKS